MCGLGNSRTDGTVIDCCKHGCIVQILTFDSFFILSLYFLLLKTIQGLLEKSLICVMSTISAFYRWQEALAMVDGIGYGTFGM